MILDMTADPPLEIDCADAESLPYRDAEFETVVSSFAARPDLMAAELIRVCRPGRTIVMANWTPRAFVGQMFRAISRYIAPPDGPALALWGDEACVRRRLGNGIAGLRCALRVYHFNYPFPPDRVVEFYRDNFGPVARVFASLDLRGREALRRELIELWSAYNKAEDDTTKVAAEYLEVMAIRG